jgi:hypothetical protein
MVCGRESRQRIPTPPPDRGFMFYPDGAIAVCCAAHEPAEMEAATYLAAPYLTPGSRGGW